MWICLNNAFFSIVDTDNSGATLLVRARREGDIENVFGVTATMIRGRDYLYRANIERTVVAAKIAELVTGINYPNFKGSVKDRTLERAYHDFWDIHAGLQKFPPYSMPLNTYGTRRQGRLA